MATFDTSYQQFTNGDDSEETPQGSGVMIHVVPECGKGIVLLHFCISFGYVLG